MSKRRRKRVGAPPRLCDFIRTRQDEILAEWLPAVRKIAPAGGLSKACLVDHLPTLLTRISAILEAAQEGRQERVGLGGIPRLHAFGRLDVGFDLLAVVSEYVLLRRVILSLYLQNMGANPHAEEAIQLNDAIDDAILDSIGQYAARREKLLAGIDRIAVAVPSGLGLLELLGRLQEVLVTIDEAVDSSSILMLEKDGRLHARVSYGLKEEVAANFSVDIGEGLTGTVAATREPIFVSDVSRDTRLRSEFVRRCGTQAFYAAPILFAGKLLGVAYMGSRTAFEFSDDDKLLFRTLVNRAAGLIYENVLREEGQRRTRELEDEARFRERFMGMLGHDLRTPLTAILMAVQQMQRTELLPGVQRGLNRIKQGARRMERMIADILDLTRGRAGMGLPITPQWVDGLDICREAVEEMTAVFPAREVRLAASGDCRGMWDHDRLMQVVSNLINNALTHGECNTPVDVSLACDSASVTIEVKNHGTLPEQSVSYLFDPFRRGKPKAGAGLGLGLYIVKLIVEAHGGTVDATSNEKTTAFVVRLPRSPSRSAEEPDGAASRASTSDV